LDTTFSFNPLFSLFSVVLYRNDTFIYAFMFPERSVTKQDGKLYLSQSLAYSFNEEKGDYILVISQSNIPKLNPNKRTCIPFKFYFDLQHMASSTIISHVNPEDGSGFDPTKEISLVVRFSDIIFANVSGSLKQITRNDNVETLRNAVCLKLLSNTNTLIYPFGAYRPPDIIPSLDDLTQWQIVFKTKFEYEKTYELTLLPSYLFDRNGKPVTLPSKNHQYQMESFDRSCSNHGDYDPILEKCICTGHRSEVSNCRHCLHGYDFDKTGECNLTTQACTLTSCGCYENIDGCKPIGNCTYNPANTQNPLQCSCPKPITGPRCELCESGYSKILYPPYCVVCSCDNGRCVNGTCYCNAGFMGPPCEPILSGPTVFLLLGLLFSGILMCAIAFGIYKIRRKQLILGKPGDTLLIDDSNEIELETKVNDDDDFANDGSDFALDDEEPIPMMITQK